jgi:ABC-type multidrug transport system fused ATPase/permease subunit
MSTAPSRTREQISNREALRIFWRTLGFARPFAGRFSVKIALTILSLTPALFLGFPGKIVIDSVLGDRPVNEVFTGENWIMQNLIQPLVAPLAGLDRIELLYAMAAVQILLIVLVGAFGTSASQRDATSGNLAEGRDDATQSENEASYGFSYAGGLFGLLDYAFTMRLMQALTHHFRSVVFGRLQHLPMTALDNERIGDAVYRVMYDTPSITQLCTRLILTPIVSPVNAALQIILVYALFEDDLWIVWTGLAVMPIALVATLPFSGALRRAGLASRNAGSVTTTAIEEGASHILAVQSLGGQRRESARFQQASWRSFSAYRSLLMVLLAVMLTLGVAALALGAFVFYALTDAIIAGSRTPGDFALVIAALFQIGSRASNVGRLWIEAQRRVPGLQRALFLIDLPSDEDAPGAVVLGPIQRGIRLTRVDYAYPDGTRALRGIDLEIPLGKVTAVCGPAGAGKTTLAYMIPRFLSPTHGRVRADGVDLATVTRDSLRSQVAFVFQETALFDATVADNLRLGRPNASDDELRRAAEIAGAAEFIERLPQGYETRLGRRGGKLSVGQKQRLSIARALVRDAKVLILDEPTSALDPATEQRLVAALRDASASRAVLVIAHRLSTIRSADQIVFLEDGAILECGSHAALTSRPNGAYRRFVELQSRGAA